MLFQAVLNKLASDDVHLYSRIAIRKNEIASNRYAAKWFNGFTLEANSLNDFKDQCDIFDWPELLTSENELIDFLYDKVSEKFVNDASIGELVTTSKIICEYAGGANLVTTEHATANATNYLSGHNYGYGVVIDNYWNILDASEGIHIGN